MTDPEFTEAGVAAEAASVAEPTADTALAVEPAAVAPPVVEPVVEPVAESPVVEPVAEAVQHTAGLAEGVALTGAALDAVYAGLAGTGPMPPGTWIDWSDPSPIRGYV